jgi:hypothetical protein
MRSRAIALPRMARRCTANSKRILIIMTIIMVSLPDWFQLSGPWHDHDGSRLREVFPCFRFPGLSIAGAGGDLPAGCALCSLHSRTHVRMLPPWFPFTPLAML